MANCHILNFRTMAITHIERTKQAAMNALKRKNLIMT